MVVALLLLAGATALAFRKPELLHDPAVRQVQYFCHRGHQLSQLGECRWQLWLMYYRDGEIRGPYSCWWITQQVGDDRVFRIVQAEPPR
jgi:hypothetical protein